MKFKKQMFLAFTCLIIICSVNLQAQSVQNLNSSKPNIIHILADDLGYDDIGCFGAKDIKTPNIDRLASSGVKFTDFYAPSSVCTPSRAAILTGKYSYKVEGCDFILFPHHDKGADPAKETLISRVLKNEGYKTALIGKWHMGSKAEYLPPTHGFDYYYGLPYCNDHGPERDSIKFGVNWPEIPLMEQMEVVEQPVDLFALPYKLTYKVCDYIKENKDQPFYIHYANLETHTPWYVPKRFQGKSEAGAYGDAVQTLDWTVGKIMDKLKELGLIENTLIVFSSDNGPLYANQTDLMNCYGRVGTVNVNREHFLRAGKGRAEFEGGDRVPAIFSWEGKIPAGEITNEVAGGIDLFSTFAWLAGADIRNIPGIDGKNITPLLIKPKEEKSPHEIFLSFMGQRLYALRKGDWKLSIDHLNYPRLFNMKEDPGEQDDQSYNHPEKMHELLELAKQKSKEMDFVMPKYR